MREAEEKQVHDVNGRGCSIKYWHVHDIIEMKAMNFFLALVRVGNGHHDWD
jgi:hypothetical protein